MSNILKWKLNDFENEEMFNLDINKRVLYTNTNRFPTRKYLIEKGQNSGLFSCGFSKEFFVDFVNNKQLKNAYFNHYSNNLQSAFIFYFGVVKYCISPKEMQLAICELVEKNELNAKDKNVQIVLKKLEEINSYKHFLDNFLTLKLNKNAFVKEDVLPFFKVFFTPSKSFDVELIKNEKNSDLRKNLYALSLFIDELELKDFYDVPAEILTRIEKLNNCEYGDFENVKNQLKKFADLDIYHKDIINPELRALILDDMPKNLSLPEKSLYIYFKMCMTLRYDDKYYNRADIEQHQNINQIKNITPQNPNVVCTDFSAIYARLLNEIGIRPRIYILAKNTGTPILLESQKHSFEPSHMWVEFDADKFTISADAIPTILFGDLAYFKFGTFQKITKKGQRVGLLCKNENEITKLDFDVVCYRVIQELQNNLNLTDERFENYFLASDIKARINDSAKNFPLAMRYRLLFKIAETVDLHNLELAQYLTLVARKLFTFEEDLYYNEETGEFKFTFVRNDENSHNKHTEIVFSYKNLHPQTSKEDFVHCILDGGRLPKFISKKQLTKMFETEDFAQIKEEGTPPGIKL